MVMKCDPHGALMINRGNRVLILFPVDNDFAEIPYKPLKRGSRAQSARRGAPWVKKSGELPIRENLVITLPYTDRPTVLPHHRNTNVK